MAVADIKSANVVINHTCPRQDEIEVTHVKLVDTESAYRLKEGQVVSGAELGHLFWRSPEAHMKISVGKPSDIFSFGILVRPLAWPRLCVDSPTAASPYAEIFVQAISLLLQIHLFNPGKVEEGVLPEIAVLEVMCQKFGPFPPGLKAYIGDETWVRVLDMLNAEVSGQVVAPFSLWTPKEIEPDDKAFVMRVMKLDPWERKTARELLADPWFCTEGLL